MAKQNNCSINISKEYQAKIKHYSNLTGLTQKQIVEKIIDKFGEEASKRGEAKQ
jgi:ribosome-associated toxin RatA of RatAB toxin-antitoxin module